MSPIKILEDAFSAGKDFGSLAGRLRDKFKSGTADLQVIYDEAESVIDAAVAKARDGLTAFKAEVERVGKDAEGKSDDGDKKNDTAPTPVVDTAAGTTVHTATDGIVTTLNHEAGTIAAKDEDGSPVVPHPDDVKAVVQATVDAGVAVPEAVAADASVTVASAPAAVTQPTI